MTHRPLTAVVACTLLWLAGCAAHDPADPLVVIVGPKAFSRFELRDADDRVIWQVLADEPVPVAELFYGEIPAGFRQQAPAGRREPRPLVVGEPLILSSVTPLRFFHHEGYVTSRRGLSIDHWEMKLRYPPTPAEPDPPESPQLDDAPAPP